jgi:3-phenylpropionate/trans-cinnamate dioxygenase ferredoxin subunit
MARQVVATTDDVPPGTMKAVEMDGADVLLANVAGVYFAVEDLCPHGHGRLSEGTIDDGIVVCPVHGARFDVRTGRLRKPKVNQYGLPYGGPATRGLRTYQVDVEHGAVFVSDSEKVRSGGRSR